MTATSKAPAATGAPPSAAPAGAGDLVLSALSKRFGAFVAVDELDLVIPQGSFFALLGPSGCGKTTTLRMVAGLEDPTTGSISIGDEDITARKAYQRPVNTVFQSYALFPHMTVRDNVAFGLQRRRQKEVRRQVDEVLELTELTTLAGRKPAQLSGGQQQRVALARAVVNRPAVLLLDEPLGALDLKLRRQMQVELKRIQNEVGITFVHVTHDQEEAMTMADTIAVMNAGRVEQLGSPADLYENPATTFAANFLGQSNLIAATIAGRDGDRVRLDLPAGSVTAPAGRVPPDARSVWMGVRPEKIRLGPAGDARAGTNVMAGARVIDVSFIGVSTQYLVRTPWDQELMVFEQNQGVSRLHRPGDLVDLLWAAEHTFALDAAQDASAGVIIDPDAVAEPAGAGSGSASGPARSDPAKSGSGSGSSGPVRAAAGAQK
ncbi:MAG: ABC transporter ATP-binding protein [bacterium]